MARCLSDEEVRNMESLFIDYLWESHGEFLREFKADLEKCKGPIFEKEKDNDN